MQIVVFDERDATTEARVERAPIDALQRVLATLVGRVRLAGEDDLDRPLRIVEQAGQTIRIREDQAGRL